MLRIQKKGELFYPGIDTGHDVLGIESEFKMEITDSNDNVVLNAVPNAAFKEIINTFDNHTAKILEDANTNRKTFKVKDSDLVIGDKIKINNFFYNIINIKNDTITINGKLKSSLAENDNVQAVGNTGIYKIPVQINNEGFYFVTIFHKSFGYSAIKYKIVNNNVQDIMQELQTIKDKLNENNIGFV